MNPVIRSTYGLRSKNKPKDCEPINISKGQVEEPPISSVIVSDEGDGSFKFVAVKEEINDKWNEENVDLTTVKEESFDLDEMAEYAWEANMNNDEEEFYGFGEEKPKGRRRMRKVVLVKPKHWCSICNVKHESAYALAVHRKKLHMNAARYACSYCPRVFFHHSNHRRHELTHLGAQPRHQCEICDRTYARKSALVDHVRAVHTGERPYVCQECGMTFTRDWCHRQHKLVHTGERPFPCKMCTKAFPTKSDHDRHVRIHTGEKPYTCKKCGRKFRLGSQLNRHIKSHSWDRPVACGLCRKTFRTGVNIAAHRRTHILNAGGVLEMFKCELCPREFNEKKNLKLHYERHIATKTLHCSHCDLAFKNKYDLTKHINIHTREKVFICDTCGKSFLRKVRLREHIKLHIYPQPPKRPTHCKACGKNYKFPCHLKTHQKNKKCQRILRQLKDEK